MAGKNTKIRLRKPDAGNLTHSYHPYAAKFNPSVPAEILARYAKPGYKVLDPFSGSGTTLVEALRCGCSAVGVDIHPLAVLVSRVKTTQLRRTACDEAAGVSVWAKKVADQIAVDGVGSAAVNKWPKNIPDFDNKDHWFSRESQTDLGLIRAKILSIKKGALQDFLWLAFSMIILKSSRQDSETRYAAVNRSYVPGWALNAFSRKIQNMLVGMADFSETIKGKGTARVYNEDIREKGQWFAQGPFDLVVTSPPYANSYDYYLYHKHRMNWLGLDFRLAKDREIGSRMEFSSQKAPIEKFFADMGKAFANISAALTPKAKCIVVQGDSRVAGVMYSGAETIKTVTAGTGLRIVSVKSVSQALTSKTFNPSFAVSGKQEHVIVLEKAHKQE